MKIKTENSKIMFLWFLVKVFSWVCHETKNKYIDINNIKLQSNDLLLGRKLGLQN